jgi:hypothetical protein
MSNDFREQLFLVHLQNLLQHGEIDSPALVEYVHEQAEECCKGWGHDYERHEPGMRGWEQQRVAQTIGGTPIVSNLTCRRCGHEYHPTEKR